MFTLSVAGYKGTANIIVTDMLGKAVWVGTHNFGVAANATINISWYAAGIYNVQVAPGGDVQVLKMVKE